MMDKIFLKDLIVKCIIGIHPWERKNLQDVVINLTLYTSTRGAAKGDDINLTIDYDMLASQVTELTINGQFRTLEALAEAIAHLCLQHKKITQVAVSVEKPKAIPNASSAGVEIIRP